MAPPGRRAAPFALTEDLSHGVDRLDRELVDRDNAETAYRNNEERHRRLIELSPDGILVIDDGTIVFANASAANILGHDTIPAPKFPGRTAMLFWWSSAMSPNARKSNV